MALGDLGQAAQRQSVDDDDGLVGAGCEAFVQRAARLVVGVGKPAGQAEDVDLAAETAQRLGDARVVPVAAGRLVRVAGHDQGDRSAGLRLGRGWGALGRGHTSPR